jgi:hypothetical protein
MHHTTHRRLIRLSALCFSLALPLQACSKRVAAATDATHIRGTIRALTGDALTVATSTGSVRVQLTQPAVIARVVHSDREHIADGSFLGITSVTQPDGSQRAVEVHVFPEAMRGTGEGSYAWDLPAAGSGGSKMTNGTAASSKMTNGTVSAQSAGSSLTLVYEDGGPGGAQTITIPPGIPVVALETGYPTDLQFGAPVFVVVQRSANGVLTANRILVGQGGVVPPM